MKNDAIEHRRVAVEETVEAQLRDCDDDDEQALA